MLIMLHCLNCITVKFLKGHGKKMMVFNSLLYEHLSVLTQKLQLLSFDKWGNTGPWLFPMFQLKVRYSSGSQNRNIHPSSPLSLSEVSCKFTSAQCCSVEQRQKLEQKKWASIFHINKKDFCSHPCNAFLREHSFVTIYSCIEEH